MRPAKPDLMGALRASLPGHRPVPGGHALRARFVRVELVETLAGSEPLLSSAAMLYTLAYPVLCEADRAFIDELRRVHDAAGHALTAPHFTLVFGSEVLPLAECVAHVAAVAARTACMDVVCRQAVLEAQSVDAWSYVYLVPDEGRDALERLHDALYAGALQSQLRVDLPYTPHITVGRTRERAAAERLCADINARGVKLAMSVQALAVCELHGGHLTQRALLPLGGP